MLTEEGAVELLHSDLRRDGVLEVDKPEALGVALVVAHDDSVRDRSRLRKVLRQLLLCGLRVQVLDEHVREPPRAIP